MPNAKAREMLFLLLCLQARLILPNECRLEENGIRSEKIPAKIGLRQPSIDEYLGMAHKCGLHESVGHAAFERPAFYGQSYLRIG